MEKSSARSPIEYSSMSYMRRMLKEMMELWEAINDRIFQTKGITTPVNIIVHTLGEVNQALSEGRYFFVDIYRDGIEISGICGLKLKPPKPLSPEMIEAWPRATKADKKP